MSVLSKRRAREAPHQIKVPKLSQKQIQISAIEEGMKAVRTQWPRSTLGDIMMFDTANANKADNSLKRNSNGKFAKDKYKEKLGVFRNEANRICKEHGKEPLF